MDQMEHARSEDAPVAVIFDIDGTILRGGSDLQRIHMGAMTAAIERVTGVHAVLRPVDGDLYAGDRSLAGFTDAGTIDLVLELAGWEPVERQRVRRRIVALMCAEVTEATAGMAAADNLLPGVATLIAGLAEANVLLGLSTGNARAVAAAKMRAAGLVQFHELLGGFGDSEVERSRIACRAAASVRAAAGSALLPGSRILLVGDTATDVHAARAAEVRCLAVGTGAAGEQPLRAAAPDAYLPSLADLRSCDLIEALRFGVLLQSV